jgi:hypothetical protein
MQRRFTVPLSENSGFIWSGEKETRVYVSSLVDLYNYIGYYMDFFSRTPIFPFPPNWNHRYSPDQILSELGLKLKRLHENWPPLWSSGQGSWLKIQRSGFNSRCYQIFWEVVVLKRGPLSLVRIIEELFQGNSGSGLENRNWCPWGIRYADHATPSIH